MWEAHGKQEAKRSSAGAGPDTVLISSVLPVVFKSAVCLIPVRSRPFTSTCTFACRRCFSRSKRSRCFSCSWPARARWTVETCSLPSSLQLVEIFSCIEIGPLTSERTVLQTISPRSASRSTLRLFLSTASAIAAANHKLSLILRAGLVILSKRCASKSLVILSITRRRGAVRAGALSALIRLKPHDARAHARAYI
jgi:hypothetical protein